MNSIAAAKRRRAQPENKPTPPLPVQSAVQNRPQAAPTQRLNPQQYLAMLEGKILALEKNMTTGGSLQIEVNTPEGKRKMDLSDYMSDVDQKFMVLAEELSTLKDTMMKLQSFTMEVNKTMFDKLGNSQEILSNSDIIDVPESNMSTTQIDVENLTLDDAIIQENDNDNDNDNDLIESIGYSKNKGKKGKK